VFLEHDGGAQRNTFANHQLIREPHDGQSGYAEYSNVFGYVWASFISLNVIVQDR
jgi:hypothetical protein